MIGFAFAVGFTMLVQTVGSAPVQLGGIKDGIEFKGGPYSGLNVGMVTTPNGETFRGLLPSRPDASPVSADNKAAVEAFIAGYQHPDKAPLSSFLSEKVFMENCRKQGEECDSADRLPIIFGEPIHANTAYQLDDGSVRIEWLYGSALYYLTTLKLSDGKIMHARTQPAWLPNG